MPRRSKVKKGGSRASNAVMALNPKVCMDYTTPVIEGPKLDFKLEDLTLYNTTGGGGCSSMKPKKKKGKPKKGSKKGKGGKKYGGSRASNAVNKLGRACNTTNMVGGSQTNHAHVDGCAVRNLGLAERGSNRMQSSSSTDVEVTGFNLGEDLGLNAQTIQSGGASSDWKSTLYSRGPVNTPNMSEAQFRAFTQTGDYVPMDSMRSSKFLGGGYKKNKKKSGTKKKGKKTTKRRTRRAKRGGGSSDWRSTVYSRGSYTAPNMPESQFRAFTQSADYLPNESMRTAAFMK